MQSHFSLSAFLRSILFGLLTMQAFNAAAHHTDTHFEDESTHKIVYQCNQADNEYLTSILFSVG